MATVIKSARLFFQHGTSDKVYNVVMTEDGDAYTVTASWGRRNGRLQEGTKALRVRRPLAEDTFSKCLREKRAKGYDYLLPSQVEQRLPPPPPRPTAPPKPVRPPHGRIITFDDEADE